MRSHGYGKKSSGPLTGPEIGRYGKVNQKLERYDIVPFRSCVNGSDTISRYRTAFGTCLVSTGDTKLVSMTTSDVEIEIRPNCTSLILPIVWSFQNRPLPPPSIHININ